MVDNMMINKPLQSFSSTKRVKSVDHRQNSNQQNLFKENFKDRQKKKKTKEDPLHVKISGNSATRGRENLTRHVVASKKSKKYAPKRIIDIRV
jgi:hypothetical protein